MTSTESEDKWQRHVVIALWLLLGLVIAAATGFAWAGGHGLLGSPADHAISSWPVGWP